MLKYNDQLWILYKIKWPSIKFIQSITIAIYPINNHTAICSGIGIFTRAEQKKKKKRINSNNNYSKQAYFETN
jgi:hypothetical protein